MKIPAIIILAGLAYTAWLTVKTGQYRHLGAYALTVSIIVGLFLSFRVASSTLLWAMQEAKRDETQAYSRAQSAMIRAEETASASRRYGTYGGYTPPNSRGGN